MTYINTGLFPFIYLSRKIGNMLNLPPSSDVKDINKFINFLLKTYYKFELFWINYVNYPFGVSIFVVAKKK